jgi:hypothetical protein
MQDTITVRRVTRRRTGARLALWGVYLNVVRDGICWATQERPNKSTYTHAAYFAKESMCNSAS